MLYDNMTKEYSCVLHGLFSLLNYSAIKNIEAKKYKKAIYLSKHAYYQQCFERDITFFYHILK